MLSAVGSADDWRAGRAGSAHSEAVSRTLRSKRNKKSLVQRKRSNEIDIFAFAFSQREKVKALKQVFPPPSRTPFPKITLYMAMTCPMILSMTYYDLI